ncbi:MAG: glutamyl-tRNA reductase [Opitutales bacterium]
MRKFYITGISWKEAGQNECFASFFLKGERLLALKNLLKEKEIPEFILLSTCNRFEIYYAGEGDLSTKIWQALASIFGDKLEDFRTISYNKEQVEAIEHIFSLASGLESEITGETEIMAQLKGAYQEYQKEKLCATILNQIFQKAIHVGKWIRTNTEIGRGKITIGSVSAELATRIFGELKESKILLMGSGEVGKSVAKALSLRGVGLIAVLSRTWANAQELAEEIGAMALPYSSMFENLDRWDIIITALSEQENLLTKEEISMIVNKRRKPLFIIDLAAPANVEKSCQDLSDVYLYKLSDLAEIAKENVKDLEGEVEIAREEISDRAKNCHKKLFF